MAEQVPLNLDKRLSAWPAGTLVEEVRLFDDADLKLPRKPIHVGLEGPDKTLLLLRMRYGRQREYFKVFVTDPDYYIAHPDEILCELVAEVYYHKRAKRPRLYRRYAERFGWPKREPKTVYVQSHDIRAFLVWFALQGLFGLAGDGTYLFDKYYKKLVLDCAHD